MIDRLGGQKQAAATMDWTTSTVSRDCQGLTLPTNDRLRELSNFLQLKADARTELEVLLGRAREARQARRRTETVSPPSEGTSPAGPPPSFPAFPEPARQPGGRRPRRWWIFAAAATAVVVVAGVIVGVLVSSPDSGQHPTTVSTPGIKGSFPGHGVKTVQIPVASLITSLANDFRQGANTKNAKTVTGFEFRNARNPALCLTADGTGSLAGQNRDSLETDACTLAANQIWIPEQWEINGQSYTHLVSDKYQNLCLNGKKTNGDTGAGNQVQLWACYYPAGNESWKFQDWYQNVAPGHQSYPLFLSNKSLCVDADTHLDVPPGIRLWNQEASAGQFWS